MLNIGLHRIETFTLRRISRLTNRYVPIYRPQEVDDGSIPQRVLLSMPTYGDVTPATTAQVKDLTLYAVLGIKDPLRRHVTEAVAACKMVRPTARHGRPEYTLCAALDVLR